MSDTKNLVDGVKPISDRIKPLLAGHPPPVQGAVLADLVSIFIASHRPDLRAEMFEHWIDTVRQLVPESEKEIFPHGKPDGW